MKRRWQGMAIGLVMLGVVAGTYTLVNSGWLTSFFASAESDYVREQPEHQRYWTELFGPNALVTYQLEYSCGHKLLVDERDISPELLMVSPTEMARTVHAMQAETRLDDAILLHGQLTAICPDCRTYFWIGEQDGCVTVWQGKDKATAVFLQRFEDMSVARLPAPVQQQLSIGIVVHSEDELAQVLEGLDR